MGAAITDGFVACWKKVGTFTLIKTGEGQPVQKSGGNVASYVCTPDGRVIHAIAGNVAADVLLQELVWARALWRVTAAVGDGELRAALVAAAHRARVAPPTVRIWVQTNAPLVHGILAERPLAPLDEVSPLVWQSVLGEQLSDEPVQELELGDLLRGLRDLEAEPMIRIRCYETIETVQPIRIETVQPIRIETVQPIRIETAPEVIRADQLQEIIRVELQESIRGGLHDDLVRPRER